MLGAAELHVDAGGPRVAPDVVHSLLCHAVERLRDDRGQPLIVALDVKIDQQMLSRPKDQREIVECCDQSAFLERAGPQILDQACGLPLGHLGRGLDLLHHLNQLG